MGRIAPERRTRTDLAVSATIVAVLVVAGAIVWIVSPARTTDSAQAARPAPAVQPATAVPDRLESRWRAASAATTTPAVSSSTVVTADGGAVIGRDPGTGAQLWEYRRDLPVCTAAVAWRSGSDTVLAVYRNSRGCSEVTSLNAADGRRTGARTSDADDTLRLITDSGYVVAQGPRRLEAWGSNLVRGIEYGRITAPVKVDAQPGRRDCRFYSAAAGGDRIAVIEQCGNDPGYRLTVLGAVLDGDEKVQQYGSSIITSGTAGPPPVLVGMSSSAIAVYDGGANSAEPTRPSIRRFTTDGAPTSTNTVDGPPGPPADSIPIQSNGLVTYFTGTATVVLDAQTMRPTYQVPGALGPGETMAGQLLLPSRTGISVRDASTGRDLRTIPLSRTGATDGAVVSLRVLGTTVIEQRGTMVEAFGPPAR